MNEAVREMTFEEEAVLYEKSARELFAKESPGCEAPPINHLVRRGMRIIRKAREEIERKHGRWEYHRFDIYRCTNCDCHVHVAELMGKPIYDYCPTAAQEWTVRADEVRDLFERLAHHIRKRGALRLYLAADGCGELHGWQRG